jgi:hypothetical protein
LQRPAKNCHSRRGVESRKEYTYSSASLLLLFSFFLNFSSQEIGIFTQLYCRNKCISAMVISNQLKTKKKEKEGNKNTTRSDRNELSTMGWAYAQMLSSPVAFL